MTVLSYSGQVELLNRVQQYTIREPVRKVADQAPATGPSPGSLGVLHQIVYVTHRYNEEDSNVREAYLTLKKAVEGMDAIAKDVEALRKAAYNAADGLLPQTSEIETDRTDLIAESRHLVAEINKIADDTRRHGLRLLDGSYPGQTYTIDDKLIGFNEAINEFEVKLEAVTASDLGLSDVNLSSTTEAERSAGVIDEAADKLTKAISALSQDMHRIERIYEQNQKTDAIKEQIHKINYNIDFTTNNKFIKTIQAEKLPKPTYLNQGASIKKATVSFWV